VTSPRRVLVTGAAGDLGRATCATLAAEGWSILLSDHPSAAERLEAARADCAAHGVDAVVAPCDVTDDEAVAATIAELGAPDAVVAGAGVQGAFAPVHEHDVATLRQVLEVNVTGVYAVVHHAARAMVAAGTGGSIVAMASMAGVSGAPNMPAYAASKAAVIGLVKSAAKDLAPHGIRVNAVSPGFIGPGRMWDNQVARQAAAGTQSFSDDAEAVARQMIGSVPLRRYGAPAEVADVVCWLAGERSSYLTGVNIEVSGGAA